MVACNSTATTLCQLTGSAQRLKANIAKVVPGGGSAVEAGVLEANKVLRLGRGRGGKSAGPLNPSQTWLRLVNPGAAYDPVFNGLTFACTCR